MMQDDYEMDRFHALLLMVLKKEIAGRAPDEVQCVSCGIQLLAKRGWLEAGITPMCGTCIGLRK